MKLRTLSVTALAVVAGTSANAVVTTNFTLFSGGQLLTTDAPVTLARSQALSLSNVNYDATYHRKTTTTDSVASDNKRNQPAGALQWTVTGSSAFTLSGRQSMFCLTPTEALADNQKYLVYRVSQYGGIVGTPPPTGAGFIPGTFAPFNAASILNAYSNENTNSAASAAVQTLVWDFGYRGSSMALGNGIGATNFNVPTFANYSAYNSQRASIATSALDANNKQTFLVYVPVVQLTDGKWSFNNGLGENQNPASQIFVQADPVPEPGTLALGAAGFLAALRRRRARRS